MAKPTTINNNDQLGIKVGGGVAPETIAATHETIAMILNARVDNATMQAALAVLGTVASSASVNGLTIEGATIHMPTTNS